MTQIPVGTGVLGGCPKLLGGRTCVKGMGSPGPQDTVAAASPRAGWPVTVGAPSSPVGLGPSALCPGAPVRHGGDGGDQACGRPRRVITSKPAQLDFPGAAPSSWARQGQEFVSGTGTGRTEQPRYSRHVSARKSRQQGRHRPTGGSGTHSPGAMGVPVSPAPGRQGGILGCASTPSHG